MALWKDQTKPSPSTLPEVKQPWNLDTTPSAGACSGRADPRHACARKGAVGIADRP
jgi:hypothetical protein